MKLLPRGGEEMPDTTGNEELKSYLFQDDGLQVMALGNQVVERWILDFVGEFTLVQSAIDTLIWGAVATERPKFAKALSDSIFKRITDGDRWNYFKSLAKDLKYEGDLRVASDRYWRCKKARDLVVHSFSLSYGYGTSTQAFGYHLDPKAAEKADLPNPLTPQVFRQFVTDCKWLVSLAQHLLFLTGLEVTTYWIPTHKDGSAHSGGFEFVDPGPAPSDHQWEAPTPRPLPCSDPNCSLA